MQYNANKHLNAIKGTETAIAQDASLLTNLFPVIYTQRPGM